MICHRAEVCSMSDKVDAEKRDGHTKWNDLSSLLIEESEEREMITLRSVSTRRRRLH